VFLRPNIRVIYLRVSYFTFPLIDEVEYKLNHDRRVLGKVLKRTPHFRTGEVAMPAKE
jgi:hypothetical protein